jgi:hypothetical protein
VIVGGITQTTPSASAQIWKETVNQQSVDAHGKPAAPILVVSQYPVRTEISWDAVTIAWDNGHVATVHHGDMREIQRAPTKRATV